ncbi:MAG: hypothetical protein ABJE47_05335 [bacterium]
MTMIVAALTGTSASASTAQSTSAGSAPFDPKSGRYAGSLTNGPARAPDTLAVSSDKAWAALNQVYSQLGLSLSVVDTQTHVIGVLRGVQRRPVGGERLSRLLECGAGVYGPNADRYTVQLTALSYVQPTGNQGAVLDTRVSGSAAANGVNSAVNCASSGRLEELVYEMLRKALGQ